MEILRVSPYKDINISFTIPNGINNKDIRVTITDMADLSVSTFNFNNKSQGNTIDYFLSAKYDSQYTVEIESSPGTIYKEGLEYETYEVVRPYVDPATKGTTLSEIAKYTENEEIARAIIDSVVSSGFYYKKKVLNISGNGSDFIPVWENVKKVLSVYENNRLVEDRTYEVTSDKSAIVESSLENINRAESAPLILPAASSDSLNAQFVYKGFANTYDYRITIEHGYTFIPRDIVRAAEMLVHDIECGKLDYYKRYVTSYNTDQYRIQFDKSLFEGTGNIIVDKILSKYSSPIKNLRVL